MEFTTKAYIELLDLLRHNGYYFCLYRESETVKKSVIIRHDVDFSLEKALEMARLEHDLAVKSTYFILLSTNFYNVFSKESFEKLKQIYSLGHEIGLHFDEKRYDIQTIRDMQNCVELEAEVLGKLLKTDITVVSMHRPSKLVLENEIPFRQIINSYSSKYFKSMKYVSDSRMNWREDPIETIESGKYEKLHILTHPFWYSTEIETMEVKLKDFLKQSISERYDFMYDNFTALDQVIDWKEITG